MVLWVDKFRGAQTSWDRVSLVVRGYPYFRRSQIAKPQHLLILIHYYYIMSLCIGIDVSSLVSFGGGRGSIFLDDVECNGTELRLDDCSHRGIGEEDCQADHREDAGVICAAGKIHTQLKLS